MDRAQRRQRRLDQKINGGKVTRGRGRPRNQVPEASNRESTDQPEKKCVFCGLGERNTSTMRPGPGGPQTLCNACGLKWSKQELMGLGGENGSEEESTEDVTVYEERMDPLVLSDLQTKLYMSDANVLKWRKVAEERLERNKELQTEIECLSLKIKEIAEGKTARPGPSEIKLRAENQVLKDQNNQLRQALSHTWKTLTVESEMITNALQENKIHPQSNHNQASKDMWNAGRNGHESIAEVNICKGDLINVHQPASKRNGISGRNGYNESGEEVNVVIDQIDAHHQTQNEQIGRNGSGNGFQGEADGGTNNGPHTASKRSEVSGKNGFDSKADVNVDIGGQSSEENLIQEITEALFTATQRKSALALVDQEFLMWLNTRTRRPTGHEMSFHKSERRQFMERPRGPGQDTFYWTGITGSSLLEKFNEETGMEKPTSSVLTNLLRQVLGILGTKRTNDMIWCLVWADCMSLEQLPGYARLSQDPKRARLSDPEDGFVRLSQDPKRARLSDPEDSTRSAKNRLF